MQILNRELLKLKFCLGNDEAKTLLLLYLTVIKYSIQLQLILEILLKQIRNKRRNLGCSQEVMAFELGISQAAYSKLESGKTSISLAQAIKVYEILGLSLYEVLHTHTYAIRRFLEKRCKSVKSSFITESQLQLPFLFLGWRLFFQLSSKKIHAYRELPTVSFGIIKVTSCSVICLDEN